MSFSGDMVSTDGAIYLRKIMNNKIQSYDKGKEYGYSE